MMQDWVENSLETDSAWKLGYADLQPGLYYKAAEDGLSASDSLERPDPTATIIRESITNSN